MLQEIPLKPAPFFLNQGASRKQPLFLAWFPVKATKRAALKNTHTHTKLGLAG